MFPPISKHDWFLIPRNCLNPKTKPFFQKTVSRLEPWFTNYSTFFLFLETGKPSGKPAKTSGNPEFFSSFTDAGLVVIPSTQLNSSHDVCYEAKGCWIPFHPLLPPFLHSFSSTPSFFRHLYTLRYSLHFTTFRMTFKFYFILLEQYAPELILLFSFFFFSPSLLLSSLSY